MTLAIQITHMNLDSSAPPCRRGKNVDGQPLMMNPRRHLFRSLIALCLALQLSLPQTAQGQTVSSANDQNPRGLGAPKFFRAGEKGALQADDDTYYWGLQIIELEDCLFEQGLSDGYLRAQRPTSPAPGELRQAILKGPPPPTFHCRAGNALYYLYKLLGSRAPDAIKLQALALVGGAIARIRLENPGDYVSEFLINWGMKGIDPGYEKRRRYGLGDVILASWPLKDCSSINDLRACDQYLQTLFAFAPTNPNKVLNELETQQKKIERWPKTPALDRFQLIRTLFLYRLEITRIFTWFYGHTTLFFGPEGRSSATSSLVGYTPRWRGRPEQHMMQEQDLKEQIDKLASALKKLFEYFPYSDDFPNYVPQEIAFALSRSHSDCFNKWRNDGNIWRTIPAHEQTEQLQRGYNDCLFAETLANNSKPYFEKGLAALQGLALYSERLRSADPRPWLQQQQALAINNDSQYRQLTAALTLFAEQESLLPFRHAWLDTVSDLLEKEHVDWFTKNILRKTRELMSSRIAYVDQLNESLPSRMQINITVEQEQTALLTYGNEFHSLAYSVHVLQQWASKMIETDQLYSSRPPQEQQAALEHHAAMAEFEWLQLKCLQVQLDQKKPRTDFRTSRMAGEYWEYPKTSYDHFTSPFSDSKISEEWCHRSKAPSLESVRASYGELAYRHTLRGPSLELAILIFSLAVMVVSGGAASAVTLRASTWLSKTAVAPTAPALRTISSLLVRPAAQRVTQAFLGSCIFHFTSKTMYSLAGFDSPWDSRRSAAYNLWQGYAKPILLGTLIFYCLPFSQAAGKNLAGRLTSQMTHGFTRSLAHPAIEFSSETAVFTLLAYVHRAVEKFDPIAPRLWKSDAEKEAEGTFHQPPPRKSVILQGMGDLGSNFTHSALAVLTFRMAHVFEYSAEYTTAQQIQGLQLIGKAQIPTQTRFSPNAARGDSQ